MREKWRCHPGKLNGAFSPPTPFRLAEDPARRRLHTGKIDRSGKTGRFGLPGEPRARRFGMGGWLAGPVPRSEEPALRLLWNGFREIGFRDAWWFLRQGQVQLCWRDKLDRPRIQPAKPSIQPGLDEGNLFFCQLLLKPGSIGNRLTISASAETISASAETISASAETISASAGLSPSNEIGESSSLLAGSTGSVAGSSACPAHSPARNLRPQAGLTSRFSFTCWFVPVCGEIE